MPKIALRRNASTLARPARLKVSLGFFQKLIELARSGIRFDLSVPGRPIAFKYPVAKLGEFLSREFVNLALDVFDLAHEPSIPPWLGRTQSSAANFT